MTYFQLRRQNGHISDHIIDKITLFLTKCSKINFLHLSVPPDCRLVTSINVQTLDDTELIRAHNVISAVCL